MSSPILMAYDFDGTGGGKTLVGEAIGDSLEASKLAWVHLNALHKDTKPWLKKELSYLDPYIVEGLLAEETRPRMTQINDGALIVLRGVNLNENAKPEDMVSIRIWIDPSRIITVQKRQLKSILKIEESIQKGCGPKDAAGFLAFLLKNLTGPIESIMAALDDQLDAIEMQVLETEASHLRKEIIMVRRQTILFRRHISPQRDALNHMLLSDLSWFTQNDRRNFQERHDQMIRYVEDLDALRERAQIVKDELSNMLAERLNKNMYVLSLISMIFLPLGFLTGLLGINVGGLPGLNNDNAFYIFCGILGLISFLQILIMRKFKWLKATS